MNRYPTSYPSPFYPDKFLWCNHEDPAPPHHMRQLPSHALAPRQFLPWAFVEALRPVAYTCRDVMTCRDRNLPRMHQNTCKNARDSAWGLFCCRVACQVVPRPNGFRSPASLGKTCSGRPFGAGPARLWLSTIEGLESKTVSPTHA